MTVEGHFPNPIETLDLYELRSLITHGEDRRIATEKQVISLRADCVSALLCAIKIGSADAKLATTGDLFKKLESEPHLRDLLAWLSGRGPARRREQLEAHIGERLDQLTHPPAE